MTVESSGGRVSTRTRAVFTELVTYMYMHIYPVSKQVGGLTVSIGRMTRILVLVDSGYKRGKSLVLIKEKCA